MDRNNGEPRYPTVFAYEKVCEVKEKYRIASENRHGVLGKIRQMLSKCEPCLVKVCLGDPCPCLQCSLDRLLSILDLEIKREELHPNHCPDLDCGSCSEYYRCR